MAELSDIYRILRSRTRAAIEQLLGRQALGDETHIIPDVMLIVSGKPFRCSCGCNVLTLLAPYSYRCNACSAEYQGEPAQLLRGDK